ncbi:MAG: hypothetical protein ABI852_18190 [Gemmatimonadaceae bacterium]
MQHPSLHADNTPDDEYFRCLGEFVHAFTKTETMLYWYCGLLVGASPDVTAIVIRDQRAAGLIDMAKGLCIATAQPAIVQTEVTRVLEHLKSINTFRTGLIHHMPAESDDWGRIVIDPRTPTHQQLKVKSVSSETLKGIIADLFVIGLHVQAFSIALTTNSSEHFAERRDADYRLHEVWKFNAARQHVELVMESNLPLER